METPQEYTSLEDPQCRLGIKLWSAVATCASNIVAQFTLSDDYSFSSLYWTYVAFSLVFVLVQGVNAPREAASLFMLAHTLQHAALVFLSDGSSVGYGVFACLGAMHIGPYAVLLLRAGGIPEADTTEASDSDGEAEAEEQVVAFQRQLTKTGSLAHAVKPTSARDLKIMIGDDTDRTTGGQETDTVEAPAFTLGRVFPQLVFVTVVLAPSAFLLYVDEDRRVRAQWYELCLAVFTACVVYAAEVACHSLRAARASRDTTESTALRSHDAGDLNTGQRPVPPLIRTFSVELEEVGEQAERGGVTGYWALMILLVCFLAVSVVTLAIDAGDADSGYDEVVVVVILVLYVCWLPLAALLLRGLHTLSNPTHDSRAPKEDLPSSGIVGVPSSSSQPSSIQIVTAPDGPAATSATTAEERETPVTEHRSASVLEEKQKSTEDPLTPTNEPSQHSISAAHNVPSYLLINGADLTKLQRSPSDASDEIHAYYDIGSKIGAGGYGVVKECTRKSDGRKFACKVIYKSKLSEERLAVMHDEIAIMRQISHPHCVRLYESFETSKKLYVVMELMTGGQLVDRIIKQGSFTEKQAANIMRDVCSALRYLHEMGIVHRDLKPENLLYATSAEDSPIKVSDFGLAKQVQGDEAMEEYVGSPSFVAPEILEKKPYDRAVDMWAIGIILYILLCGFPPFFEETMEELYDAIKKAEVRFPNPYWSEVSSEARDLVSKLLVVDPAQRFTADQVLYHPWMRGHAPSRKFSRLHRESLILLQSRMKLRPQVSDPLPVIETSGSETESPAYLFPRDTQSGDDRPPVEVVRSRTTSLAARAKRHSRKASRSRNSSAAVTPRGANTNTNTSTEALPPENHDVAADADVDEQPLDRLRRHHRSRSRSKGSKPKRRRSSSARDFPGGRALDGTQSLRLDDVAAAYFIHEQQEERAVQAAQAPPPKPASARGHRESRA